MRPLPLIAALLTLAACRLVDQRTFEPKASGPSAAQLKPSPPRASALTITFLDPNEDWVPSLRDAVHSAQAHQPDVHFRIVTPVPTSASREVQDRFIKQGAADATMIAREMEAAGVSPDHITVGLRGDPGSPPREASIYTE